MNTGEPGAFPIDGRSNRIRIDLNIQLNFCFQEEECAIALLLTESILKELIPMKLAYDIAKKNGCGVQLEI